MAQEASLSPYPSIPCHLYTHHHLPIEKFLPNLLNKRFFKHIHTLHLTSELELNFKSACIKTLRTLSLTSRIPTQRIHITRIQRFVKPRQKYLKSLKGDSNQPKIQKLLPLLTELNLGMDLAKWRPLAYSHNLQALSLEITNAAYSYSPYSYSQPRQQNPLFEELRTNYTGTFPRIFSKLQNLKSLDIKLPGGNLERTQIILHLFRKIDLSRFHLEYFSFKIILAFEWLTQASYPVNQGVRKALPYIKELTLQDTKSFISIFDGNLLENLTSLEVRIAPQNSIDFSSKLVTLKKLEKLKRLNFSFRAYSVLAEREFLESFTLPINLEAITLTLINMKWNRTELTKRNRRGLQADFDNEQRFVIFFNQWKELKSLKTLSLTINEDTSETKRCPGLAGNFTSRIIKQINSLENLSYTHALSKVKPRKKKGRAPPVLPVKSLDLEEFWEALVCSKNTLQSVKIDAPEIAFPLKIGSLDNQFACLKTLSFGKSILWAKDLAAFWSGFKSLEALEMQGLRFQDKERFEWFIEEIREDLNMKITVDVKGIEYEFLRKCLSWLVHKKEFKRKFELDLINVQIQDQKGLENDLEILRWQANLKKLGLIYHNNPKDPRLVFTNEGWTWY